jgi:hypothetical protein
MIKIFGYRYYSGIYQERLRKTTNVVSQNSRYGGLDYKMARK